MIAEPTSINTHWIIWIIAVIVIIVILFLVWIYMYIRRTRYLRNQTEPSVSLNKKIVSAITYVPKQSPQYQIQKDPKKKEAFTNRPPPPTNKLNNNVTVVQRSAYIYKPSPNMQIRTVLYTPIQYTLRDYYVLTSYNTCIIGPYDNGIVSIQALRNALSTGFRCLDFEIYSEIGTDNPIVSCSTTISSDGIYPIQTGEPILFSDIMECITNYAFVSYGSINCTDPLIINLRIKTSNTNVPTKMAYLFEKYSKYMVSSQYNMHNVTNFGTTPLPNLMNRISIFVDSISDNYMTNDLFTKYVNMTSKSGNLSIKYWKDFPQTGPVSDEIVLYNKQRITMVLPDPGIASPVNKSVIDFNKYGCQFVGLVLHDTNDTGFIDSIKFFEDNKSAYVLKPEHLRYIAPAIKVPIPQNPNYSYAPRKITMPDNIPGTFNI